MAATGGPPARGGAPRQITVDHTHDLWPAAARLERARQQADELINAVLAFLDLNKATLSRERDPKTGEHVWLFRPRKLEVTWGIWFGEIIHDLRSCLDHLVWQAMKRDGGVQGRHTGFPVCLRRQEFRRHLLRTKKWTGKLVGLSQGSVAVISKHQPCHGGQRNPRTIPIYLLDVLWNIDKHRTVNLFATETEITSPVSFKSEPPPASIWSVGKGMLKEGAPVCRIPGGTYLRVEVKADTGTDVVLDNTGDALPNTRNIGPILTTLVAVVEAVLKDFLVLWEQPPPAPQPPPPIKWHERAIWWLRRRICD